MSLKLKKSIEELDYVIKDNQHSNRLLWVADHWDTSSFREYLNSFDREFNSDTVIYDKRNLLAKVAANRSKGIKEDLVVKEFKLTRKYDQLRFCFLDSKAVRSLKMALALEKIGVKTPQPVAVVEKRGKFNQLLYSYYLTTYIDYDYNLLDILKDKEHQLRPQVQEWLPRIAQDVRRMHQAGVIHNDLHAGNILVDDLADPDFYYIDLNRGRIKKELSMKQRMKDLARFKLTREEQELFMQHYAPDNYQELLERMIRQREQRRRFLEFKRKLKRLVKS